MARDVKTIRIESILGGHSPTTHFAAPDQFRASFCIDPSLPMDDDGTNSVASGLIRPVSVERIGGTHYAPKWIGTNPKNGIVYVYDAGGSVYSILLNSNSISDLGDLNDGGSASGNGQGYYDNYVYFARDTTVARYGPLNGTPSFTDDYWTSTLGLTALTNTTYPEASLSAIQYPNHILHRHSDGRLYLADVVDNRGTLHYIATTKTTVEGDTNNGSKYNALQVGYGLWPTAIESYGSDLAIAFYEGSLNTIREQRAKLAFWDTTSQNVNKITWVEFPDTIISSLKNVNGVLYVVSGIIGQRGFRLSRFVGGYTVEEIGYFETGSAPLAGAIDGTAKSVLVGSYTEEPSFAGCVFSSGLQKASLSSGLFSIIGAPASCLTVSALNHAESNNFGNESPIFGGSGVGDINGTPQTGKEYNGIFRRIFSENSYDFVPAIWWSQMYRIGQPFKITKIRIPLAQAVAANMTVVPKIYTDDGNGTTYTLATINNTNYPNSERNITYRLENTTGQHNFWLELRWTGSVLCTVGLPITIEYELLDD